MLYTVQFKWLNLGNAMDTGISGMVFVYVA